MSVRSNYTTAGRRSGQCGSIGRRICFGIAAIISTQLAGSPAQAVDGRQPAGRVVALHGSAQVVHQGQRNAEPLAVSAPVFQSDVISTGPDSRLKLQFADDTVTLLGEKTTLTITRFVYSPEQVTRSSVLSTTFGFVRTIVDRLVPQSTVQIQTVTAVASVRSTDWIVEAGPDSTAVVVLDGAVGVRSLDERIGGAVVLETGEGTVVPIGGAPTPPSRWGQPRINRAIEATQLP